MIAVQKYLLIFVVANSVKAVQPYCYIFNRNIAGFLRQYRFGGLAEFAKTKGSLASFVIYLLTFFSKWQTQKKLAARGITVPSPHRVFPTRIPTLPNPNWSNCTLLGRSNRSQNVNLCGLLSLSLPVGAQTFTAIVSRRWSIFPTGCRHLKRFTVTDSLCRSWKRKAKAAFGRTRVPRPHRIFSPSRTIKSPRSFNPSLWPSLNGSPLCCA